MEELKEDAHHLKMFEEKVGLKIMITSTNFSNFNGDEFSNYIELYDDSIMDTFFKEDITNIITTIDIADLISFEIWENESHPKKLEEDMIVKGH